MIMIMIMNCGIYIDGSGGGSQERCDDNNVQNNESCT